MDLLCVVKKSILFFRNNIGINLHTVTSYSPLQFSFPVPSQHPKCYTTSGRSMESERIIDFRISENSDDDGENDEIDRVNSLNEAESLLFQREVMNAVIPKKNRRRSKVRVLDPLSITETLHARISSMRWESALKLFDILRDQTWYRPNPSLYAKLFTMLGKCQKTELAISLFYDMIDEGCIFDMDSYNALISMYTGNLHFGEAFSLFGLMKKTLHCHPDAFTYLLLVKMCVNFGDFESVRSLLSDMRSLGVKMNTEIYNRVVDGYGKSGRFGEMEVMILKHIEDEDCMPNSWTMNSWIRAFGGSGEIEMMEVCYEKLNCAGIHPTIRTFNILLDAYGRAGEYEKMCYVLMYMRNHGIFWNTVTYNVLIHVCRNTSHLEGMEYLFGSMQAMGIRPDEVTLCTLLSAYGDAHDAEKVGDVLRLVDEMDVTPDTVFFNCLVDVYGKMGFVDEMKKVIEKMNVRGCDPDEITHKTMIRAIKNGI